MKILRIVRRRWFVLVYLGIGIVNSVFLVAQVNAQNQSIEILAERLREKGVPLSDATLVSRVPVEIELVLQSSSAGKELTPEDIWFAQLARREADLAYRIGIQINSYTLTLINSKGEVLQSEKNTVAARDLSQQTILPTSSQLDDVSTEQLVKEELHLSGMSLDALDVSSDALRGMGQSLVMQLSAPDVATLNSAIPSLLGDPIRNFLGNFNSKHGTRIVICWIRIKDQQGHLLINYVWDVETRTETSLQAEGTIPWYPVPAPTYQTPTPATSVQTPAPDVALPNETSMPADNLYP